MKKINYLLNTVKILLKGNKKSQLNHCLDILETIKTERTFLRYPLYQRGNPSLRIFLPNFWMKLIKSEEPLPPNVVLFRTSIQMTKFDVKNYLEKIYKVPVVDVKVEIKMGTIRRCREEKHLVKDDDYKEALVYLPKNYKFEFPTKIGNSDELKKEMERYKKTREEYVEALKDDKMKFVPKWFAM